MSGFAPVEPDAIEKLMAEKGMFETRLGSARRVTPVAGLRYELFAWTAAPSSPGRGWRMTDTGIVAIRSVIGSFRAEGLEEPAVLERRQDLRRDAAADVDAGRRHRSQRQVARFGAVRR